MRFAKLRLAGMSLLAAPVAAQDAPPLFEASRVIPVVPGQWTYAVTATGSEAVLRNRFSILCDRMVRRVTLRRIEPVASASIATAMTITTDLGTQLLPVGGMMAVNDRVLDAISFSRGRFIVTGGTSMGGGGSSQLVVPSSPEAARTIEDCRI